MHVYTTMTTSYLKELLKHLQPKSFGNVACLLQSHRTGNPAVDALIGTAKKETGEIERDSYLLSFSCVYLG